MRTKRLGGGLLFFCSQFSCEETIIHCQDRLGTGTTKPQSSEKREDDGASRSPSAKKAADSSAAEEARVKAQAEALGPEELKKKGELLAAAVAKNETPPPDELLASLPIPDAEKVASVACTAAVEEAVRKDRLFGRVKENGAVFSRLSTFCIQMIICQDRLGTNTGRNSRRRT